MKKNYIYLAICIAAFLFFVTSGIVWYSDGSADEDTGRALSPLYAVLVLVAIYILLQRIGIIETKEHGDVNCNKLYSSLKISIFLLIIIIAFDVLFFVLFDVSGNMFLILLGLSCTGIMFVLYRLVEFLRFKRMMQNSIDEVSFEKSNQNNLHKDDSTQHNRINDVVISDKTKPRSSE